MLDLDELMTVGEEPAQIPSETAPQACLGGYGPPSNLYTCIIEALHWLRCRQYLCDFHMQGFSFRLTSRHGQEVAI